MRIITMILNASSPPQKAFQMLKCYITSFVAHVVTNCIDGEHNIFRSQNYFHICSVSWALVSS